MKKTLSLMLVMSVCLAMLSSCAIFLKPANNNEIIRIGYLTGPTGMGMAKLIIDNNGLEGGNEKYVFTKYTDTQLARADLAAGKIDLACLPSNEATVYQTNADNDAKILALNCLNSLFLVSEIDTDINSTASLSDFEGKTVYTCKNGTPRIVLEHIIKSLGLDINVSYTINGDEMSTPQEVNAQIIAGNIPNAVLPEPLVSTVVNNINTSATQRPMVWPVVNLSDEWNAIYDSPIAMGCIVANGDFVKKNKSLVDKFLDEYEASIEYITNEANFDSAAQYIQETGIIPSLPIARSSLQNLKDSIVYIDGSEMKDILTFFYQAVGISVNNENIYYEK